MDLEHEKRLTSVEERAKSNGHRLDRLEPVVKEIHVMSETLVNISTEMKHINRNVEETNKKVDETNKKVDEIEREPAKRWKDSTKAIFNAFLGAIGAAAAGGIIYLLSTVMK